MHNHTTMYTYQTSKIEIYNLIYLFFFRLTVKSNNLKRNKTNRAKNKL